MELVSSAHRNVETVTAGEPCTLIVSIMNSSQEPQSPVIRGLEQHEILGVASSHSINIINGKRSETYQFQYTIRMMTPGHRTVGPAVYAEGAQTYESNTISVVVKPPRKPSKQQQSSEGAPSAAWNLSQDDGIQGEIIPCTLTFQTTDPAVTLEGVADPIPDDVWKPRGKATWREEERNGTTYHIWTQNGELTLRDAGTLTLPALRLVYARSVTTSSWFFPFQQTQTHYATAAPVAITVHALDAATRGIGLARSLSITWEASTHEVAAGETITLRRIITGACTPEQLTVPIPEDPEGHVRIYTSGSTTHNDGASCTVTTEFIVHGLKHGTWTHGGTELPYFDVETRTTQKAYEPQFTITVIGDVPQATQTPDTQPEMTPEQSASESQPPESPDTKPDESNQCAPCTQQKHIPWTIIFILYLIPPFIFVAQTIAAPLYAHFTRKRALRKTIRMLTKKELSRAMLVAQSLEALRLALNSARNDDIRHVGIAYLKKHGASTTELETWNDFMDQILHIDYSPSSTQDIQSLKQDVVAWIHRFSRGVL